VITAAIIARDEERNIVPCLQTLAWADERLVLDGGSVDRTVALCRAMPGVHVAEREFDNFACQRNAAMGLAENDWILFVDADERVTPELAAEARAVVASPQRDGYMVPRFNCILGKVMRHTGWYPDYQLRLLDRRHGRYVESVPVHEIAELDCGEPGHLREHLLHYNYQTLTQFFRKQERYTDFEARQLLRAGKVRWRSLLSMPAREFVRRYWTLQGYRDGGHGLLLSALMAYFTFRRYWKCLS